MLTLSLYYIPPLPQSVFNNFPQLRCHIFQKLCISKFTTVSHKSSINKPIGNAVTLQNCVPNKKQKTAVAFGEIKKLTPFKKTSKMEMTYLGGK